ncbi:GMC oxidoreductase [Pseudoroseicyclus tamaricis]|uniref:GMC family oxidoreductase n=1 Tax=Pseudoroseicyclus tamaricis TaxID=2705421 RepID=A0A6B2JEW2_9RHOB|nr:GMC family oxidoreductase [Pseudoroseicyclus tamaricis]NDU99480.1 GMC family oxidoreductase [Pseudoroseicyclus tamaricis]
MEAPTRDAPFAASFDVIVIGTGMGGGTAGRALAEAGMRVLFLERGRAGHRAEANGTAVDTADPFARALHGLWPEPAVLALDGVERPVNPVIGSTVGGSSVFYAATLERPERHDLEPTDAMPHPTGGWPIGWDEMRPWFDAAEALYEVRGEADPLGREPQPALLPAGEPEAGDAAILAALRKAGRHPYQLHSAIRGEPGCLGCVGTKCPRPCKRDGRSAGVEPALATGRAELWDEAEVLRLKEDGGRITGVTLRRHGEMREVSAPRVLLAAGALNSPRLLLASASEAWPEGLGNRSGLVGRGLMFHFNELFALFPGRAARGTGAAKAVGLRDFYAAGGERLGMVQALGVEADFGAILHALRERLAGVPAGRSRLAQEAARLPAAVALRLLGSAKIFVGLLEDLPYDENRVLTGADGHMRIEYRITDELRARRRRFRRLIRGIGRPVMMLSPTPEPNLGHPCGTLRFGEDPARAVVAADGRVHGLENLWVLDSSIFPTSMGVNPSLTIAAHALRVADSIARRP